MIKPERFLALSVAALPLLQESMVRFGTVRGWGDYAALSALRGKTIVDVKQTTETVAGPAPLAKVFLESPSGEADEISVVWGVRRSSRP